MLLNSPLHLLRLQWKISSRLHHQLGLRHVGEILKQRLEPP